MSAICSKSSPVEMRLPWVYGSRAMRERAAPSVMTEGAADRVVSTRWASARWWRWRRCRRALRRGAGRSGWPAGWGRGGLDAGEVRDFYLHHERSCQAVRCRRERHGAGAQGGQLPVAAHRGDGHVARLPYHSGHRPCRAARGRLRRGVLLRLADLQLRGAGDGEGRDGMAAFVSWKETDGGIVPLVAAVTAYGPPTLWRWRSG